MQSTVSGTEDAPWMANIRYKWADRSFRKAFEPRVPRNVGPHTAS